MDDLTKQLVALQRQVDNLIKPEVLNTAGIAQLAFVRSFEWNNIADDTAVSIAITAGVNRFFFAINANGGEYFLGVCPYQSVVSIASSGFSVVAGNGTLAGTTGPDTFINVRANNDTIYIENRSGGARNFSIFRFGGD